MNSPYEELNKKLEKEILFLQNKIAKQNELLESSPQVGGEANDYVNIYNPSQPNVGKYAGLAVGDAANPAAVVQNPKVIASTAAALAAKTPGQKAGAFGFETAAQKPLAANNIGLGMGIGLGDNEFAATRDFVNKYSKNFKLDPTQSNDPNEVGYLSWKAVNDAVSQREMQNTQKELEKWGLFDPNSHAIPDALGDLYSTQKPDIAFSKKVKATEKEISGEKPNTKKEKGKFVSPKIKKSKK